MLTLVFGGMAVAGLAGYPDPCNGPLVDPISGGDLTSLIQDKQNNDAFPDPNPALLDSPADCDLVHFRIPKDQDEITSGTEFTGPEGFKVTIYKESIDGNYYFAFDSNFGVMHVFAKGGPEEGNLYKLL